MAHAIRFEKTGGPEVLTWQAVDVGKPGQGQVRLRHTAVGLNYIDTYQRSGLYQLTMPSGLGSEGAGIVEEVGPGVSGLKPGDRVAYSGGPIGAYADERVMPADRLVPVPDGITDQQAAAIETVGRCRGLERCEIVVKNKSGCVMRVAHSAGARISGAEIAFGIVFRRRRQEVRPAA